MRFNFPFAGVNAESLYQNNQNRPSGFYPVGISRFWHSGVHLTSQNPVVAIGDGEVVAYRINENYIEDGAKVQGNETDKQFSTGFVLIRHTLEFPPGSGKNIIFFSLYMHLLPWNLYGDKEKKRKPAFFNTTRYYASSELKIWDNTCKQEEFKPITAPTLGTIPAGSEFFLADEEDFTQSQPWDRANSLTKPKQLHLRYRQLNPKQHPYSEAYVHVSLQKVNNYRKETNTPLRFATKTDNAVVILDKPMAVKAGEIIGYPGKYNEDTLIHFEIFMENVDFMTNPRQLVAKDPEQPGKNLHYWILDGYFEKFTDCDKDGYCDLDMLKEKLATARSNRTDAVPQMKTLEELVKNTQIARCLRSLVCQHPTEWSEKTDQIVHKWERLEGFPWFGRPEKINTEIVPHIQHLQWWDQLAKARIANFPPDPLKLWFFHPVAFVQHLERILGSTDILNAKARNDGIQKIKDNIWAYYKGYELETAGNTLVPQHEPEKGEEINSLGYYLVKRTVSKGKTTYSGKEEKTKTEGLALLEAKGVSQSNWKTFCNLAASVISVEYGAPNLQNHKGTERNVNTIVSSLAAKDYDTEDCMFQSVDYRLAEQYASRGGFAFAIRSGSGEPGHIATLVGGYKDNIESEANINTYQAGEIVGYTTIGDGFGKKLVGVAYQIWRKK